MEVHGYKLTKLGDRGYRIGSGELHIIQDVRPEANRRGKGRQWDIVHPSDPDRAFITGTSIHDAISRLALIEKYL